MLSIRRENLRSFLSCYQQAMSFLLRDSFPGIEACTQKKNVMRCGNLKENCEWRRRAANYVNSELRVDYVDAFRLQSYRYPTGVGGGWMISGAFILKIGKYICPYQWIIYLDPKCYATYAVNPCECRVSELNAGRRVFLQLSSWWVQGGGHSYCDVQHWLQFPLRSRRLGTIGFW